MNIGFFVTSHGFGHAARVCAIIDKLSENPKYKFFIFTQVPKWFFENSLRCNFEYHSIKTDVGLMQTDPFHEDMTLTIDALEDYFPFRQELISHSEELLREHEVDLIICDISPLGIILSKKMNLVSILIENFTWDWIYSFYEEQYPKINKFIEYLSEIYDSATYHISCTPNCSTRLKSFIVDPVFREVRDHNKQIRKELGWRSGEKLILISMGGIPIEKFNSNVSSPMDGYKFIIPINKISRIQRTDRFIYLPHNHGFYHPDLVNLSELIVGKVGYSTISEVYALQKPFIYLGRKNFPESPILEKFIQQNMLAISSSQEELFSEEWFTKIEALLATKKSPRVVENGAMQIAKIIENII